jgi:glycosyltransferase involved in cell wall biosynthesis
MTKLVVNLYKYGETFVPSIFDRFDFDNFKLVSYFDAAKAMNINRDPSTMGFFEIEGSIILDEYIKKYEELFGLELLIKNALCGSFIKHHAPIISIVCDNYIRGPEILFGNKFMDDFNHFRERIGFSHLQKTSIENSMITVFPTKQMADDYMKEFGKMEHKIIPNGVDTEKFKPFDGKTKEELKEKYMIPKDKKVGIWVGFFTPNHWAFMPQLIKEFPDVFWVLSFKHRLDDKALQIKSKNVRICYGATAELMPQLLNCANFLIDPAFWNNFGMINMEAASCNIPVITSRTGWFYDAQSGDIGEIVTKQEYEMYKKAVEDVIKKEFEYHPREVILQEKLTIDRWREDWKTLIKETVK